MNLLRSVRWAVGGALDHRYRAVTQRDNLFGTNVAEGAWLRTTGWPQLFPRAGAVFRRRSLYEPIGNRSGRFFAEELSRFLNISGACSANHRPSLGIYR